MLGNRSRETYPAEKLPSMPASDLLNDKAIKAALKLAGETNKAKRISDGAGLYLETRPTGVGWWRFRYFVGGKEKMLSLGTYPDLPLKLARERRDQARQLVATGGDPSLQRQADKAAAAERAVVDQLAAQGLPGPGTFEYVAREWLTAVHEHKVSAGHAAITRVRLEQNAFPWIGRRPIAEIEAPELLTCLRRVEGRGAVETAHRVKDICGQVFRFGIASGACQRNPAADLRDALKPVMSRHHAAIVDPDQVGALLRDMENYGGQPVTHAALKLSAMLLLRPGELRHLEWAEVDLEAALITVPAARMKRNKAGKASGSPHLVPLAPQAVKVLEGLRPLTGHGRFVFPSLLTGERCMSENTVRGALRRLGYSNDEMTAHGFRATARTMLAERLGVDAEVIEAQLAHTVSDALGRAYNRTQYLEQRRQMMAKWADYLDRLRASETRLL